jgi:oligopeptide/dipeptide ABC transporter ATP-binding protein
LDKDTVHLNSNPGETPDLIHPMAGCRFSERCALADADCSLNTPEWVEISPTHKTLCSRFK